MSGSDAGYQIQPILPDWSRVGKLRLSGRIKFQFFFPQPKTIVMSADFGSG